jgi:hypothetical protein
MLEDDDSASIPAQWRSHDEMDDMRDMIDGRDPLAFDKRDDAWDDECDPFQDEAGSITDLREAPIAEIPVIRPTHDERSPHHAVDIDDEELTVEGGEVDGYGAFDGIEDKPVRKLSIPDKRALKKLELSSLEEEVIKRAEEQLMVEEREDQANYMTDEEEDPLHRVQYSATNVQMGDEYDSLVEDNSVEERDHDEQILSLPSTQVQIEVANQVKTKTESKLETANSKMKSTRTKSFPEDMIERSKEALELTQRDTKNRKAALSSPSKGFSFFRQNQNKSMSTVPTTKLFSRRNRQTKQQEQENIPAFASKQFSECLDDDSDAWIEDLDIPLSNDEGPRGILKNGGKRGVSLDGDTQFLEGASAAHRANESVSKPSTVISQDESGIFGFISNLLGLTDEDEALVKSHGGRSATTTSDEFGSEGEKKRNDHGFFESIFRNLGSEDNVAGVAPRGAVEKEDENTNNETLEERSMTNEVGREGDITLEDEDLEALDFANEPILVSCLRDNHCPTAANCIMCQIRKIDGLGCHQTYEFLDGVMTDPRKDGGSFIDAGSLALDNKNPNKSQKRSWRNVKKQDDDNIADIDVPIRMIEIPMVADNDSEGTSLHSGSLGARRKTGLRVNTNLEHGMKEVEEELHGQQTRSLFGRRKRQPKQHRGRN